MTSGKTKNQYYKVWGYTKAGTFVMEHAVPAPTPVIAVAEFFKKHSPKIMDLPRMKVKKIPRNDYDLITRSARAVRAVIKRRTRKR